MIDPATVQQASVPGFIEVGVGGIFALGVIHLWVQWQTLRPNNGNGKSGIFNMVKDLHKWHGPDRAGGPTTVVSMLDQAKEQTKLLRQIESNQERVAAAMEQFVSDQEDK